MYESRIRPDGLRHIGEKSDDIVLRLALDLVNAHRLECSDRANLRRRPARHNAQLLLLFHREQFDFEPNLVFVIFGPDRPHFGACVARDHIVGLFFV